MEHIDSMLNCVECLIFKSVCVTEEACSSVKITLSVTDYGVCNFKKQTSEERRV